MTACLKDRIGFGRLGGWVFAGTLATSLIAGAHDHINAGALGSAAGASLSFINGDRYAEASGYVVAMESTAEGPRAGLYSGSITFTALAATPDYGGPAFGHAVFGAHLAARVESVEGPAGGRFGFWEAEAGEEGGAMTWDMAAGEDALARVFVLSETAGDPGDDPYGHIHGRIFTASVPGLYVVTVRAVDLSTSGPGAGPWHPASEPVRIAFQAGVALAWVRVEGDDVVVRYAALEGGAYQLERAPVLSSGVVWEPVGAVVIGRNRMQEERLPRIGEAGYFRLKRVRA